MVPGLGATQVGCHLTISLAKRTRSMSNRPCIRLAEPLAWRPRSDYHTEEPAGQVQMKAPRSCLRSEDQEPR